MALIVAGHVNILENNFPSTTWYGFGDNTEDSDSNADDDGPKRNPATDVNKNHPALEDTAGAVEDILT